MRNVMLIIKNYFNCFLGRLRSKKSNTAKTGAGILILGIFSLLFLYVFINLSIGTTYAALELGEPTIALYTNASMAVIFCLLMMITKSTMPNKNNDDDTLSALPLKKSEIIIAKVFYDYLFDLAIVLITILPAYIVYYVLVPNTSIMLVARGVVICLLIPLFLCAMGYFLSLIFSLLASKFRFYSIIQSIFTIVLTMVFLVGYYSITLVTPDTADQKASFLMNLAPIMWIVNFVSIGDILSIIWIMIVTIIPFIICIIVKTKLFGVTFARFKNKNKPLSFKESSVIKSLYKKEIANYFNSSLYIVNTMFGGILLVFIAIALTIIGKDYILNIIKTAGLGNLEVHFMAIVLILVSFLASTICTTSSSISFEGNKLWILKVHPVSEKKIFIAKALVNLTVSLPFIIISGLLLSISFGLSYLPFLILIPAVLSCTVSMVGLLINLIYPKLDWVSETSVIKQSMSAGISLIANMFLAVVPFVVYFSLYEMVNIYILLTIIIAVNILISMIVYLILMNKGKSLFKKLIN